MGGIDFPGSITSFRRVGSCPRIYSRLGSKIGSQLGRFHNPNKYYIAKPEAESQGRGIFLFQSLESIKGDTPVVVQEYIDKPFLI